MFKKKRDIVDKMFDFSNEEIFNDVFSSLNNNENEENVDTFNPKKVSKHVLTNSNGTNRIEFDFDYKLHTALNGLKVNGKFGRPCKLVVDKKTFYLGDHLGKGSESLVYQLLDIRDNTLIESDKVIKVYKKDRKTLLGKFMNIHHDNIEKCFEMFSYNANNNYEIFITERLERDLFEFNTATLKNIWFICHEVLNGLDYLHRELKIAHTDLSESNVMIGRDGKSIKLIDFSLSMEHQIFGKKKLYRSKRINSLRLLQNPVNWGYDLDVWQCGCLIYYITQNNETIFGNGGSRGETLDLDRLDDDVLIAMFKNNMSRRLNSKKNDTKNRVFKILFECFFDENNLNTAKETQKKFNELIKDLIEKENAVHMSSQNTRSKNKSGPKGTIFEDD